MNLQPESCLAPDWAQDLFPDAPLDFIRVEQPTLHYKAITGTLLVLCSAREEADGKRWIHVSCSHPHRLPSWTELRRVKDVFIGKDRKAIQVLPAASEYVNIHDHVLHLWACLDEDPLPDFRVEGQI